MAAALTIGPATSQVTSVASYLRVSTLHQDEGNQAPEVEALIKARFPGAQLTAYREKKSAAKKRPVFEGLMRDAKAGRFQALVVWSIDRFGRSAHGDVADVLALDAAGVQVVSCREPWLDTRGPTRDLLLPIISWVAQQERERLRERIAAGLERVREAGGATKKPVFGLVNVRRSEADVAHVEVDKKARPTLVRMAHLFVAAGSFRGAAIRLNAEVKAGRAMPPSKKSGTWSHIGVRRMLTNEELRDHGVWSAALLAQVDRIPPGRNAPKAKGAATPKHLASSFVACGFCGGGLTATKGANGTASSYVCAKCNSRARGMPRHRLPLRGPRGRGAAARRPLRHHRKGPRAGPRHRP